MDEESLEESDAEVAQQLIICFLSTKPFWWTMLYKILDSRLQNWKPQLYQSYS